jgi:hypothetical protein
VLGHQVGGNAHPEHFGELDYSMELLLLEPEHSNVEVSYSPDSLSLEDAERCSSVDM